MVKRRAWSAVLGAAVAWVAAGGFACDALVGLKQPVEGALDAAFEDASPGDVADAGRGSSDGGAGQSCAEGRTQCWGHCVSLAIDPANCGLCGHVCGSDACTAGVCAPGTVPLGTPVRSIAVTGAALYLMTDDEILLSIPTFSDAGLELSAPAPIYLLAADATLDGGTLRSFAPDRAAGALGATVAVAPGDTIVHVNSPPGTPSVVLARDAGDPISLASNGATVYWASSDPATTAITAYTSTGTTVAAVLQPGDEPCSLAAGSDGVYWASARGTWFAASSGAPPVAITPTPFDRALAPLGPGRVAIASDGSLSIYSSVTGAGGSFLFSGQVDAIATSPSETFCASGGGFYAIPANDEYQSTSLFGTGSVPYDCHRPVLVAGTSFLAWVDGATGAVTYTSAVVHSGP